MGSTALYDGCVNRCVSPVSTFQTCTHENSDASDAEKASHLPSGDHE